ncbi:CDP-glycerol glycerophosphotransferase family protein, partial [Bacillus subtilis]
MRKKIKQLPIIRMLSRFMFACFACLPAKKKLVVFESFSGKQYSCNPRAIYEYMRSHDMPYELVWSVNKDHIGKFEAQQIPYVRRLSVKWFYYMARAGFWVTNSRMPNWVPKPAHTTYVQTWHGTPLKKLVGDMEQVRMP